MARATFTNEQLCVAWAKAKANGGNRGDVVRDLMEHTGVEDTPENYRKMYNNVTQRRKQLGSHPTKPITFPELAPGKKGARRTDAEMDSLQALLNIGADNSEEASD
jgi:hypothetical protein